MKREEQEYLSFITNEAKSRGLLPLKVIPCHSVELKNDYVNVYKYGENLFKIVYIKFRGSPPKKNSPISTKNADRRADSISRAKNTVKEIALCNNFTYFCTFTQNAALRDRFDLSKFREDFARFVRNENRGREEKIKYLLIPELHKDGAVHMHGLLMGLQIGRDLQTNEHGYLDWFRYRDRFGFFSCSKIKDKAKCANYITKYITKSFDENACNNKQHSYFASHGLKRRETFVYQGWAEDFKIPWDFENDYCKITWISTS